MSTASGPGVSGYASIAGTAVQVVGAIQAGVQAQKVADYNAEVAAANAQAQQNAAEVEAAQLQRQALLARQDALIAQQAQQYKEARQQEQFDRIQGTSRAIVAASGLLMTGSPLVVYEANLRQQRLDILAGRYDTALKVRAFQEEATQREYGATVTQYGGGERLRIGAAQAGLLREEGSQALTGSLLSAAGSLATGTARYAYLKERGTNPSLLSTQG